MAGSFSLAEGGNTATLSALASTEPYLNRDLGRVQHKTITGKIYLYDKYDKVDHQLTVNAVSKTNADYVNGWWANGTTVVYTPDTDSAGTTYNIKIVNTSIPLSWMPETLADSNFQGTIMLMEI